jgi:capsular polysaccharide biosynthesis protein
MELREFFAIFGVHKKIFWSIVMLFVVSGMIFYFVQAQTYKTYITLNITRGGAESTNDYTYDSFYRLQADSKFADTVVQWIDSPYILEQIFSEGNSGITRQGFFSADRMSSQVIEITFVTSTKQEVENIANNLQKVLNAETQKLNKNQNQKNWFIIVSGNPITGNNQFSLIFLLLVSLLIGFFVAFWIVLFKHYMREDK